MGELLGALGLAWPRLLLYPGGVFALVAARLLAAWLARCGLVPAGVPAAGPAVLLAALPPLAALTLLPLAPARSFPYGLDLVIALALVEWPRLLSLREPRRDDLARAYLPLLVAGLGMAVAVGGLELTRLLRFPEGWAGRSLLVAAAGLWLAALPRLLEENPAGEAGQLRALGLLLLAALPLLGALAALTSDALPASVAGWVLPPGALLAGGAIVGALARWPRARDIAEPALAAAVLALITLNAW